MERIIACIAGASGSGKSFFVANLHNALIYDTDIGGGLAYADARIAKNKSERIEASTYAEIEDDLKRRQKNGSLAKFNTLAIDHVTALHQAAQIAHNPTASQDYGRANEAATREWRKVRNFCRTCDFNLIVTAHLKGRFDQDKQVGQQPDGAKNIEGDMSIVLYLNKAEKTLPPSEAIVQKWRRDPDDPRGAIPPTFKLTMENFVKLHGNGALSAPREPVALATAEQVSEINRLVGVVKLPEGTTDKWLKKAGVESFEEMPATIIQACIDHTKKTLTTGA